MTLVMEWMGMHALMIYILAACNVFPIFLQGFYWGSPHNNIVISLSLSYFDIIIFYYDFERLYSPHADNVI